MGTKLSRIIFPKPDQVERSDLYYHVKGNASQESGALLIARGSAVRFDSYFNALFYPKYLQYTHVSSISLHLCISGQARLRVLCSTRGGNERIVFENCVSDGQIDLPAFILTELPSEGALFFELEAQSEVVNLYCGWYETKDIAPNEVKVAAIICTYRRETYVKRNLKQLQNSVWTNEGCPIKKHLDVFVVDNGNTLALEEMPHIQFFPNKNCGGSGGFTRGLIEVYRSGSAYTHVLFMDDDISFETEVLVKTVQLLRFAKQFERPLCIGGQMLLEDKPTVQFEAGAFYKNGRLIAVNQGMDLSALDELLKNEVVQHVQYNAWWYCCFPISVVEQIGLPLPLFIKTDDVEYGLRMKPHILLMNGIGVWHTAFSQKYSPHLEYYIKRNELVVSAIHDNGAGIWPSLWKLIRASGKVALIGNPKAIDFMLWAYRDFMEGPDLFLRTDEELLNIQLLRAMKKPQKGRLYSLLTTPFLLLPVMLQVIIGYKKTKKQYKNRIQELTCMEFWRKHLGIYMKSNELI